MNFSGSERLPAGWAETTIGDVTVERIEQAPPVGGSEFIYVDISSIENALKKITDSKLLRPTNAPTRARQRLKTNDVLVSMTRPNLNAVAKVPSALDGAIGSTGFDVLRTTQADPGWLFYLVQTPAFVRDMSRLVQGVLYPAVRPRDIRSYSIPLAPLNEQRRVVSEIEKQFTRLEAAVAALKRVQVNLKRYRASVLKAACEGRLVPTEAELARREGRSYEPASELLKRILSERRANWEANQLAKFRAARKPLEDDRWKQRYEEPEGQSTSSLPTLPTGWAWVSLEQVSWDAGYGTSQKCEYECSGPPVLRIPNIIGGKVDLDDLKFTKGPLDLTESDALAAGDMLIVRTNGSRDLIGRAAVVEQPLPRPHFFASYLIRYRLVSIEALSNWISTTWDESSNRARIEALAATTAGQYNVSVGKLDGLPIPVPPQPEMRRIVTEIECRLSVIDELEIQVEANLKRADRLRQAILKRAFEGKLVPQDPSDEPASVLLERIRAERAASAASPAPGRTASRRRPKHTGAAR